MTSTILFNTQDFWVRVRSDGSKELIAIAIKSDSSMLEQAEFSDYECEMSATKTSDKNGSTIYKTPENSEDDNPVFVVIETGGDYAFSLVDDKKKVALTQGSLDSSNFKGCDLFPDGQVTTTGTGVRVRSGPGLDHGIEKTIDNQMTGTLLNRFNNQEDGYAWYKAIFYDAETEGWARGDLLEPIQS
ncbi:MAG: SH3 domain-containing protein [Cyanobacteria bacterium P01_A01_bin.135]